MFPLHAAPQASWNWSKLPSPKHEKKLLTFLFTNPGLIGVTADEPWTIPVSYSLFLSYSLHLEEKGIKKKRHLSIALFNYSGKKSLCANFVLNIQHWDLGSFSALGHLLKIWVHFLVLSRGSLRSWEMSCLLHFCRTDSQTCHHHYAELLAPQKDTNIEAH